MSNFSYTHSDLKKIIIKSQHNQRCWDLDAEMDKDDVEVILHSATNCPSKQNFAFYRVHAITNRELIEQIHEHTTGIVDSTNTPTTNSQTLANLLLVFEDVDRSDAYREKWALRDNSEEAIWKRDQDQALGVAAGYTNVVASMMGYGTGCCACGDFGKIQEILGLEKSPMLLMGIGVPDATRNRRTHHKTGTLMGTRRKEDIEVIWHD